MALATFAMAVASGVQAILYLSEFGTTARTDAFFAALALYTVFGIFTQAIRVTSVPLLVAPGRIGGSEFAASLVLIAIPVLVACEAFPGPLAEALAPGADPVARAVTEDGVRILGVAMVLQLGAGGAATLLAVWDRFNVIAGGYIGGAAAALASYFVAVGPADELALGWSLLVMAVVAFTWMAVGVQRARQPGRLRLHRPARFVATPTVILGRTLVYFVVNGLFLVTLAYASHESPGDATVLSYAYFYASYLVAGTGLAVGISRVPHMSRRAQAGSHDVVADTVPQGFRYALLVTAPALAGLVAVGAPLIGGLFPDRLPPSDVETLQRFGVLLGPWLVAALLVHFILPALFALGRARLVNVASVLMVVLHVLFTSLGQRLFGMDGIAAAMFVAPLGFGLALLAAAGGARRTEILRATGRDAIAFLALAAGTFGLAAALAISLPTGVPRALTVAAVGSTVYLAALRVAAPRQLEVLLSTRRRAASV